MRPRPDPVTPGQESVWDYPRPAVAQASSRHVWIEHHGVVVADTRAAFRVPRARDQPPAELVSAARQHRRGAAAGVAASLVLRVERDRGLLASGDRRRAAARCRLELSRAEACLGRDARLHRVLRRSARSLPHRRRAGYPAARRVLRRLDNPRCRRAVQGRAGQRRLVTMALPVSARRGDGTASQVAHARPCAVVGRTAPHGERAGAGSGKGKEQCRGTEHAGRDAGWPSVTCPSQSVQGARAAPPDALTLIEAVRTWPHARMTSDGCLRASRATIRGPAVVQAPRSAPRSPRPPRTACAASSPARPKPWSRSPAAPAAVRSG